MTNWETPLPKRAQREKSNNPAAPHKQLFIDNQLPDVMLGLRREIALLLLLLVCYVCPSICAGTPPKDALSGVGYADREAWAAWRGQTVRVAETWNDAGRGEGRMTWSQMNALYTVNSQFANGRWNYALSLAQPLYAQGQTVKDCASEAEIRAFLQALGTAWPRKDAFLRLSWEFNGDWYPWAQRPGDEEDFKNCWKKWHRLAKEASPDYKLVWNPNCETNTGIDPTKFWPGKDYVDAAGPDYYGWSDLGHNNLPRDPNANSWTGGPLGINAWRTWVASQGVPFAVPEWGIKDGDWGWASPDYIQQMRDHFELAAQSPTGLAYESYFDAGGSPDFGCRHSLNVTLCPQHATQAAKYKQLWSTPYLNGASPSSSPLPTTTRSPVPSASRSPVPTASRAPSPTPSAVPSPSPVVGAQQVVVFANGMVQGNFIQRTTLRTYT